MIDLGLAWVGGFLVAAALFWFRREQDEPQRDRLDAEDFPDGILPPGADAADIYEDDDYARRYVSGEPLLGSRGDRQDELGRAALLYVLRQGLGTHFLLVSNASEVAFTREEVEELREAEFDPSNYPEHYSLLVHVEDAAERNGRKPRRVE